MPTVKPGSKVLVSGANGYIAVWVVRTLLERGYSVRGTVRSESKAGYLRKMFSSYGDKHEVVVVEDITKEGAFDEAVKGVDAIAHTASPFHFKADHPDELVIPAVKGTISILQSALKYGSKVQRVVVTGSCASVLIPGLPVLRKFTEADWNEPAIQDIKEKGRDAPANSKYRASKTLAEKAVWEFVEKNKSSIKWDASVLNPPFVFGPPIHEITSSEQLNQSLADLYKVIVKGDIDQAALIEGGSSWIDVRDLAMAHCLALEKEAAGGQRTLVTAGAFMWQDWVLAANAMDPPIYKNLSKGNAAYDPKIHTSIWQYDTSKAAKILGIKYRTIEESLKDMLVDFKSRNW